MENVDITIGGRRFRLQCGPGEAPRVYDIRPLPFERAVERALREWESLEPLGAR